MLKKITNGLNVISIISWVLTIIVLVIIRILETNDMSIKLAWNDVSRFCDDKTMAMKLYQVINFTIVLAGSTNLISAIIRKVESRREES